MDADGAGLGAIVQTELQPEHEVLRPLGVAQGVDQAFPISPRVNQVLVLATLAGFPLALVLSWLYEIRAGRIRRTDSVAASPRARLLMWLGLAISVLAAAALGWLLLRGN